MIRAVLYGAPAMSCRLAATLLILLAAAPARADDEAARDELKALAGKWAVAYFEHKGRVAPIDEARADLTIEPGGKMTLTPSGRAGFTVTLGVDPSRSPK